MSTMDPQERITRSDLEDAFRSFQGGVTDEVVSRKQQVLIAAGVGAALLLALMYMFGKRRGKRTTTYVEIRRF
jgi:Ca2+-binding EF-hand superfamily protein